MLTELIRTHIAPKELRFKPGGDPVTFEVAVINSSDQFATFQVEVLAAGSAMSSNSRWYVLSPEVCTKKPPGDLTQFSVQIFDSPKPGFVGVVNLTVRVFSLELRGADSRQVVRLVIEGTGAPPPEVDLPVQDFRGHPGDRIDIPVIVQSLDRQTTNVTLRLLGLNPAWLPDGNERRLQLLPNAKADRVFSCQIPAIPEAPSQAYPFVIEATQPQVPTIQVQGVLTVLPLGFVEFQCQPLHQSIPAKSPQQSPEPRSHSTDLAIFQLQLHNYSNLAQTVSVEVSCDRSRLHLRPHWMRWKRNAIKSQDLLQPGVTVTPETALLETAPVTFGLTVQQPRPWLGWMRRYRLQAKAITTDSRIEVRNDTQALEVDVLPKIPFWLQISGTLGALLLLWWLAWLWLRPEHTAPVNTVRFSGLGNEVISGADDQTLRRWQVDGSDIHALGILGRSDKAVRVVRYRPVNNNQVAVGYENGEIQLFDLLSQTPLLAFTHQPADRVFDLVFTRDARSLFSGHGSGLVVQWNLESEAMPATPTKVRAQQVGFAVNALAMVGPDETHVAVAGRFNQLALWNLKSNTVRSLSSSNGSEANYILSLATAEQKPYLLASADNQGSIKLWNLRACLTTPADCEILDEWTPDKAVRSVALSADGCYLASANDDGRALLWALTARGDRRSPTTAGIELGRSRRSLNAIDVAHIQKQVIVTTGGDDHQVRLWRTDQTNPDCQ